MHRSTHVAVTTTAGLLLLQRRGFEKDTGAGLWDSACAGHVQPDETYTEAARRELVEELGIVAEPHFAGTCRVASERETELCGVHTLVHDGPFRLELPELAGLCLFAWEELPSELTPAVVQVHAWLDRELPAWRPTSSRLVR